MAAENPKSYIFGPVPSRRLGRSLGVDVIPVKTCSFDCIYCESGPTTQLSLKREDFCDPAEVLRQLKDFFKRFPDGADALTFSSAGEPTLYARLGELIRKIKETYPRVPLVVLTNGSLMTDPEVREDLLFADRVIPSLDAVTPGVFRALNRPHPSLEVPEIIEGLSAFRRSFRGRFHLEIMLVEGVNDSVEELESLARAVEKISPHAVELNTVVRPPAQAGTCGSTDAQMKRAAAFFPPDRTAVIGVFEADAPGAGSLDVARRILLTVERRPCTVPELAASLGISKQALKAEAKKLCAENRLSLVRFDDKDFLCLPGRQL